VFAATDVHYLDSGAARAALVLAEMAAFEVIAAERLVVIPEVDEYEPGAFFRRELPCLRAVLAGVAKSRFATATHAVPVMRGGATRPLYVTAAGMPTGEAAEMVRAMAGPHRLPDALRRVDQLARGT
jgi:deoxyribonuclease V